jgi:hypothetical protein
MHSIPDGIWVQPQQPQQPRSSRGLRSIVSPALRREQLQLTLLKAAPQLAGQSMLTLAPLDVTLDARSPQLCAMARPAFRFSVAARHDTSPRLPVKLPPAGGAAQGLIKMCRQRGGPQGPAPRLGYPPCATAATYTCLRVWQRPMCGCTQHSYSSADAICSGAT